jgi:uncharacterized membrane protein (UPF0127 family)
VSPASRSLLFALTLLVAAVAGGCAADDTGDEPAQSVASSSSTSTSAAPDTVPTTLAAATSSAPPPVQPEGFDLAPVEITLADGEVCALCLWVAATPHQRQRGLMGVTDLRPADGMVFTYEGPASRQFWMRGTPMPLSIAFFAADGSFVSATDMEPCLSGPAADCPRYSAAGPYVSAIEVPQGRLAELGIGAGSRLALDTGPGCDAAGP